MGETRGNTVLRPEVAVLMRPGTRIQFGVEPERSLILPLDESIAPGPVFSALMAAHRGTNITDALERAQQEAGLPERFVRALVQDLWQADLVQREPPERPITLIGRDGLRHGLQVALRENKPGRARLLKALAPTGTATRWLSEAPVEKLGLVVITGMEVPSLPLSRVLYQRGIAHLHATFRDGALIVGPFVPGRHGPCGMCFEAHRRIKDPARSLLALQLRTYTPVAAKEWTNAAVSVLMGQLSRERLDHLAGTEVRVDLAALDTQRHTVAAHPSCPVCGHGRAEMGFA